MNEKYFAELIDIVGAQCVKKEEMLAKHTTFKIGGAADYFVTIKTSEQLSQVIKLCRRYDEEYSVIGKGSNMLVSDKGYRGTILRLEADKSDIIQVEAADADYHKWVEMRCQMRMEKAERVVKEAKTPEEIQAAEDLLKKSAQTEDIEIFRIPAGIALVVAAMEIANRGLAGFEFAAGVPGTLGGAVAMNAGAYNQEMKDTLLSVTAVDRDGQIKTMTRDELQLGYRRCIVQQTGDIVTEAVMGFVKGEKEEILAKISELAKQRASKQPLEYPSAGSTFKRPEGYFAGKLIMDAGLRGFTVGGAQVSEKHCGFVVNKGGATAADVAALITQVQKKVKDSYGVQLETEVKYLGEF